MLIAVDLSYCTTLRAVLHVSTRCQSELEGCNVISIHFQPGGSSLSKVFFIVKRTPCCLLYVGFLEDMEFT